MYQKWKLTVDKLRVFHEKVRKQKNNKQLNVQINRTESDSN